MSLPIAPMDIASVLSDAFTALDLVGPYEVIAAWPDARVRFVEGELRAWRSLAASTDFTQGA